MRSESGPGRRAPILGIAAFLLALLLVPSVTLGADWASGNRVTSQRGSRLDSLHQLAASGGSLHIVHPRIGPNTTDDRIAYQRSSDNGVSWSKERSLFGATAKYRHVMPNLAIAARGSLVAFVWRVLGAEDATLFVRVSRDGGRIFGAPIRLFETTRSRGIGVPAVAIGDDVIAVAWTDRATGKIRVRSSRDEGRSFRPKAILATTKLSIDCKARVTDGLVGIAAVGRRIHVAWSHAPKRACQAAAIKLRTSSNRGKSWNRPRTITKRRSYGWPELDARGGTVLATAQAPGGGLIVARSSQNGRNWSDSVIKPASGRSLSAGDVVLLPSKNAMITYVDERIRRSKLLSTRVVSRFSRNDGARFLKPKAVTNTAPRLRMAPNIAATGARATIVFQSGPLDASHRNLYATRLE